MIVDKIWMAGIVGMMILYGGFALYFSLMKKCKKRINIGGGCGTALIAQKKSE